MMLRASGLVLAAALAAGPAIACMGSAASPTTIFWSAPPAEPAPEEVVLRIDRHSVWPAELETRNGHISMPDMHMTYDVSRAPTHTYRVTRVVAGEFAGREVKVLPPGLGTSCQLSTHPANGDILVGAVELTEDGVRLLRARGEPRQVSAAGRH